MTTTLSVPDPRLAPVADLSRWRLDVQWASASQSFPPDAFLAVPEIGSALSCGWNQCPTVHLRGNATMRLDLASAAAQAFLLAARDRVDPPTGKLSLVVEDQEATVFAGSVAEAREEGNTLALRIEQRWPWDLRRLLCRDLAELSEGIAASIAGPTWLPQVFGEIGGIEAPALFAVDSVRSLGQFARDAVELPLREMPDWPTNGRVQIDDEVLSYGALLDAPPRLAYLERPLARDHKSNARVWRLPPAALRWIAADHPSTVLAVRADAPDGDIVPDAPGVPFALSGRTATSIVRAALPMVRGHAAWVVPYDPPRGFGLWRVDGASTALFPHDAFPEEDSAGGAILSAARPLLRAEWDHPMTAELARHDRLVRARLRFRIVPSVAWLPGTTLRCTVSRGAASVSRVLTHPDEAQVLASFEGSALVPEPLVRHAGLVVPIPTLSVEGTVRIPAPVRTIDVDATALLPPGDPWSFFATDGTPPRVEFELTGANAAFTIRVGSVHWSSDVSPATRVDATARLFTDQRGRLTEGDGACDPVGTIETLLTHGDFAGVSPSSIDAESSEAARTHNAARGRRFAAAFASRLSLEDAIVSAMIESATVLIPRGAMWFFEPQDRLRAASESNTLHDRDVLEFPAARVHEPPALREKTIRLLRTGQRMVRVSSSRAVGAGTATWELAWLCAGAESLAAWAFERFGRERIAQEIPLRAEWIGAGLERAFVWCGDLAGVAQWSLRAARVSATLLLESSVRVCWSDGGGAIVHSTHPARLVVEIGGRAVAAFEDGVLLLAGRVRESVAGLPTGASGPAWIAEPPGIVLRTPTLVAVFAADGDLQLSCPLSESSPDASPAPSCAWDIDGDDLVLGTPELGVVATLRAADGVFALAGSLRERASL